MNVIFLENEVIHLTTVGLSDSINRKKQMSKNEEACCFGNEISKHLHLKFVRHDERGFSLSVRPHAFLHNGWMDFLHIGTMIRYHGLLMHVNPNLAQYQI